LCNNNSPYRLKKIQQKKRIIREIEDQIRAQYIQDQINNEEIPTEARNLLQEVETDPDILF
jgi:hypothetical protein